MKLVCVMIAIVFLASMCTVQGSEVGAVGQTEQVLHVNVHRSLGNTRSPFLNHVLKFFKTLYEAFLDIFRKWGEDDSAVGSSQDDGTSTMKKVVDDEANRPTAADYEEVDRMIREAEKELDAEEAASNGVVVRTSNHAVVGNRLANLHTPHSEQSHIKRSQTLTNAMATALKHILGLNKPAPAQPENNEAPEEDNVLSIEAPPSSSNDTESTASIASTKEDGGRKVRQRMFRFLRRAAFTGAAVAVGVLSHRGQSDDKDW